MTSSTLGKQPEVAAHIRADAHGRRLNMVFTLITISRNQPPTDQEKTILDWTLRWLDEHYDGIPVLGDLLKVIQDGPDVLQQVALNRGDWKLYQQETKALEATLLGLTGGGKLGEIFSRYTSNPMRRDRAVEFDVSSIDKPNPTSKPPSCSRAGPTASEPSTSPTHWPTQDWNRAATTSWFLTSYGGRYAQGKA